MQTDILTGSVEDCGSHVSKTEHRARFAGEYTVVQSAMGSQCGLYFIHAMQFTEARESQNDTMY